jgi:hypothetical protein
VLSTDAFITREANKQRNTNITNTRRHKTANTHTGHSRRDFLRTTLNSRAATHTLYKGKYGPLLHL